MPNRMIRESLNRSEKISELSDFQFRVWIGLITYVDDYGRGDARPKVIKGEIFPLRDRVTFTDISKAIADLAAAGCISLYEVDGRPYLQFPNWGKYQRVQRKYSKCPDPPQMDNPPYPTVSHGDPPLEVEEEEEVEVEEEVKRDILQPQAVADAFNRICTSLPKVSKITEKRAKQIKARNASLEEFEAVFTTANESDFLSGRNGKWGGCGFDWIIQPSNWQKVLEGNYSNDRMNGGRNGEYNRSSQKPNPTGSSGENSRPRFDFTKPRPKV